MGTVAVIPARGGSKRIPRKNLLHFLGVPLVQRVTQTLVESRLFERVVVSTDDSEIAELATRSGAWVPQLRDSSLADDFTPTAPVVLDAIGWFSSDTGVEPREVLVAYPTSLFLRGDMLLRLANRFRQGDLEHVFIATEIGVPIGRTWTEADEAWVPFDQSTFFDRSQDLPKAFADSGQGYWSSPQAWEKLARQEIPRSGAVVVNRWEAVDIDDPEDLELAEVVWKASQMRTSSGS